MLKDNDAGWMPPQRKPISKDVLDRVIDAEEAAASREHRAQRLGSTASTAR